MATATANGYSSTTGFVEQVKRSDNRVALKVGDNWFSTFGTCEANQGDEVQLKYTVVEKDGRTFRNIKHVEPVATKPAPTVPTGHAPIDKDSAIARAVALKCATQWAGSVNVVRVLVVADAFYGWLQGDPVAAGDYEHAQDSNDEAPF